MAHKHDNFVLLQNTCTYFNLIFFKLSSICSTVCHKPQYITSLVSNSLSLKLFADFISCASFSSLNLASLASLIFCCLDLNFSQMETTPCQAHFKSNCCSTAVFCCSHCSLILGKGQICLSSQVETFGLKHRS